MDIRKKALGVGGSAVLIASLLATIAAPVASAATVGFAVTGAGSVPSTGTSGAVSIAVTEPAGDGWGGGATSISFTLNDHAGNGDPVIDWSGTPVITGQPSSLTGIAAAIVGDTLTVSWTASNTSQVENFTVGGMKITTTAAASGGINLYVGASGLGTATVPVGVGTASGVLTNNEPALSTSIQITPDAGSQDFHVSDVNNGSLNFASPDAEARAITVYTNNTQVTTAATGSFHASGTVVTQSVAVPGLISSPGTVVPMVTINTDCNITTVLPGEQNQWLDNGNCELLVGETSAATLPAGTVVTFKFDAAGVLFSQTPNVDMSEGGIAGSSANPCNISYDRTSCSVTTPAASTGADSDTIELESMKIDVASTVPLGTKVHILVTTSGGQPQLITANQVAVVGRVVVGVAAQPTIWINYNDQPSGMITLTESGPGYFTAGPSNNYFGLCLTSGESFTRAPWAVVTVGDLTIRSGVVGASSVQGTLYTVGPNNCVYWIVYTNSTKASTIEIRGSDAANVVLPSAATNGPRLSVPGNLIPGPDAIDILSGNQSDVTTDNWPAYLTSVSNAVRAYKSDVVVAAVTQPVIAAGSTSALAGNVTISETLNGQFKPGEWICVGIEARTSNNYVQDAWFNTSNNNMLPIISTNNSGLMVGTVDINDNCNWGSDMRAAFEFQVTQQAFAPALGVITISNLHYVVSADAPNGNVILHVFSEGCEGPCANVAFGSNISNASIGLGATASLTGGTALGVTSAGPFSASTKIAGLKTYITWQFGGGANSAGKHVEIWLATKIAGVWTPFHKVTTRIADIHGNVYYWSRSSTAKTVSVRAFYPGDLAGLGTWSQSGLLGRWK